MEASASAESQPSDSTEVLSYARAKELTNDYNETVLALICFAALVCHDGRNRRPESKFAFGRRMDTSPENPVSANGAVTPDLVAQKSLEYGIVAEVKKQLSREPDQWFPHLRQLRKYDDELTGWWSGNELLPRSDAVLLVHQTRTRAFVRFLEEEQAKDAGAVGPRTVIVEFNRADEAQPFLFFRKEWGALGDADLEQALGDGRSVPMNKVLASFPNVRFYDARPPLESLMSTLWVDYFMSRFDFASCAPGDDPAPIQVSVGEITSELQRAYGSAAIGMEAGSRCAEFPRAGWVRQALRAFAEVGIATDAGDAERYTVSFKRFKVDVIEWICKLRAGKAKPAQSMNQLALELEGEK